MEADGTCDAQSHGSVWLSAALKCIVSSSKGVLSDWSEPASGVSRLSGGSSYVSSGLHTRLSESMRWMVQPWLGPGLLHTDGFLCFQVTNYDSATGLPLIQLWNLMGDEVRQQTHFFAPLGFVIMQTLSLIQNALMFLLVCCSPFCSFTSL